MARTSKINRVLRAAFAALLSVSVVTPLTAADANAPAKPLFGNAGLPSVQKPQPIGSYAKGCLAGGIALPTDGPTWQAMRLSRNRRWGHPDMIALVERLSREAAQHDGWPGLLVGDIAQPRGGPMLSGHASHQVGLDADIWLTPMPARTLSGREREDISATSMLKTDTLYVDPDIWTQSRARLLVRAASYREVERIFVHPGIKKKLCDTWQGDRSNFNKSPAGAANCKPQDPIPASAGCDKSLDWWFTDEPWRPAKPAKPDAPKKKPREVRLGDLPAACATVIDAPGPVSEAAVTFGAGVAPVAASAAPAPAAAAPRTVPVPTPKPFN
jgi:penicillin-insensitive murein endopeptidase